MFKFLDGKHIVLASTSPRRKAILEQVGMKFDIFESEIDEKQIAEGVPEPSAMVKVLAECKAKHALQKFKEVHKTTPDLLIASDTVVALDGEAIGKPENKEVAKESLKKLLGTTHFVHTGVCFYYRKSPDEDHKMTSFVEMSKVSFGNVTEDIIDDYVSTGESFDKAGAYGTQGIGSVLIEKIEGDYYTIVGFPIHRFFLKVREAFTS